MGLYIRVGWGIFTVYRVLMGIKFGDMRIIGEIYQPDLALLPIGDHFTMGPREAAYAAQLLNVPAIVPIHYGTSTPDRNAGRTARTDQRSRG